MGWCPWITILARFYELPEGKYEASEVPKRPTEIALAARPDPSKLQLSIGQRCLWVLPGRGMHTADVHDVGCPGHHGPYRERSQSTQLLPVHQSLGSQRQNCLHHFQLFM